MGCSHMVALLMCLRVMQQCSTFATYAEKIAQKDYQPENQVTYLVSLASNQGVKVVAWQASGVVRFWHQLMALQVRKFKKLPKGKLNLSLDERIAFLLVQENTMAVSDEAATSTRCDHIHLDDEEPEGLLAAMLSNETKPLHEPCSPSWRAWVHRLLSGGKFDGGMLEQVVEQCPSLQHQPQQTIPPLRSQRPHKNSKYRATRVTEKPKVPDPSPPPPPVVEEPVLSSPRKTGHKGKASTSLDLTPGGSHVLTSPTSTHKHKQRPQMSPSSRLTFDEVPLHPPVSMGDMDELVE